MINIEFFHDAVCGWCYLLSPRLRQIAEKYPVKIVHRAFVLQRNESEMIARFGSMKQAKQEILQHWQTCQRYAEHPELINIEGMRDASFNYPTGYLAAVYAKAIEQLGGQEAHWDFFDAVQRAHLCESRNIADADVLNAIAIAHGFSYAQVKAAVDSPDVKLAVLNDKRRAVEFGISSIPSLIINGSQLVSQTLTAAQLEQLISSLMSSPHQEVVEEAL